MEWYVLLPAFFGALVVLLLLRVPVAFALLGVNIVAAILFFGLAPGMRQLTLSIENGLTKFTLIPIPLFILMGELLFRSGIASRALEVIEKLLGQVPGRLGVLATVSGTMFGVLSGSTLANTALLGSTILPEMEERGYSPKLAMGSILASGGLAMIIPPSALAVVWGATAGVPIGPLLIAGVVPGLFMALTYLAIILVWGGPLGGAPGAQTRTSRTTIREVMLYVAPLGLIVFLVLGFIFLGIATASESAAVGAVGAFVLTVFYRRCTREMLRQAIVGTAQVTGMLFFILVASEVYSQVMSFSGATSGIVQALLDLPVGPIFVLILMQLVIILLGFFLEQVSIMLVTLPFFMPVVASMGWDPLWFGIIMLINLQIALTTPPFGLSLFVMKGVAPARVKLTQVYAAAVPFVLADIVTIAILITFPALVTTLPRLMAT